jgi:hypothetical protein
MLQKISLIKLALFSFLGLLVTSEVVVAADLQFICIGSSGALTVRAKKCLSSEVKALLSTLRQTGSKRATGESGISGLGEPREAVLSDRQLPSEAGNVAVSVSFCNIGEVVLGGGCRGIFSGAPCNSSISSTGSIPIVTSSSGRQGWRCAYTSLDIDIADYSAYSICAKAS